MSDSTQPAPAKPPVAPDLTGRTLGDFQILRRIGSGGMGQVYLARQLSLKREVALKLLRNELNENPTALKRFQAEAEAVARLNHTNIVQVYAIGETDGVRYMALEFVDGRNLRDYLARKGPPDLPVTISVVRQVSAALQKAHERGLVHRDIKPENILITRKVEVKVTDFGLSRFFTGDTPALNLTQSGLTLGTPLYMSPEQVQGQPLDHRSDIYSFGVTCYHLLAGEPPFKGVTAFDVAIKHVQEQPRPLAELRPDLPADLCGMVHKMMAKNPADRYASARDILRDLAKVREGLNLGLTQAISLGTAANPSGVQPLALTMTGMSGPAVAPPPPIPWGRWVLAGGVCVVAALAGVFAYAKMNPLPAPPAPAQTASPTSGLPDVRVAEKLTTTRERELLALVHSRDVKGDDVLAASIELGLMYVKEGRLEEADTRFARLAGDKLDGVLSSLAAGLAGRLGHAVVLSHQNNAAGSNKSFTDAIQIGPLPKSPFKADRLQIVQGFLSKHPDLAHAVADALNRNATNLGVARLTPPPLEALRSPRGVPGK
ncbi:MAG TPA: serine/threonine-protein kinase [Gemmataceae bacterium]|nr:serine/threonine-protein kinase [Gemmataceae bacterium]